MLKVRPKNLALRAPPHRGFSVDSDSSGGLSPSSTYQFVESSESGPCSQFTVLCLELSDGEKERLLRGRKNSDVGSPSRSLSPIDFSKPLPSKDEEIKADSKSASSGLPETILEGEVMISDDEAVNMSIPVTPPGGSGVSPKQERSVEKEKISGDKQKSRIIPPTIFDRSRWESQWLRGSKVNPPEVVRVISRSFSEPIKRERVQFVLVIQ